MPAGHATLDLRAPDGATAVVHQHGAHVTSWVPAAGDERLFLSTRSAFEPGVAIRGGIPVIFPQFASEGPLPKHGFARTRLWAPLEGATVHSVPDSGARIAPDSTQCTLSLRDTSDTRMIWPHAFDATLQVRIGGDSLAVCLTVANSGDDALEFTAALHTYLRVDDIDHAAVHGLGDARYRDSASGGAERVQHEHVLRMIGEIDRVYLDAPHVLELREPQRSLRIESPGFPDVVVWNPGAARALALPDLEIDGWRRMVCIEAAAVGTPVRLEARERWTGCQTLTDI